MTAEFFHAGQLLFRKVDCRRRVTRSDRRQVIASTVASAMVVPILRDSEQVIQVRIAQDAKGIQYLVLDISVRGD